MNNQAARNALDHIDDTCRAKYGRPATECSYEQIAGARADERAATGLRSAADQAAMALRESSRCGCTHFTTPILATGRPDLSRARITHAPNCPATKGHPVTQPHRFTTDELRVDPDGRRYVHRTVLYEDETGMPLDVKEVDQRIDETLLTTEWSEVVATIPDDDDADDT
ncbi:MAG: hypothetical protein DLM56_08205 [Pseudonocardiales bacterium]|nr:MAG: hypothetical protein DLM56_08205 [Pseudonocardiales bacterium]